MKLLFTALLCLILTSCSASAKTPSSGTVPTLGPEADSFQIRYGSQVEAVSFFSDSVREIFPLGEDLLVISDSTVSVLDSRGLERSTCKLEPDHQVIVGGRCIGIFDPESRQLLLLDSALAAKRTINLPADLSGRPLLSNDSSIYYCTSHGIYHWDLDSGIRLRIRETGSQDLTLIGLHWQDSVLHCRLSEDSTVRDFLVDARTGQLLKEFDTPALLATSGSFYFCEFPGGFVDNLIFGTDPLEPQCLLPAESPAAYIFLPQCRGILTRGSQPETDSLLRFWDLEHGLISESLLLDYPLITASGTDSGTLWLLIQDGSQQVLLKWHPLPDTGSSIHVSPYYPADKPDTVGISQCQDYARSLSDTYGVQILVGIDASAAQPWDYSFQPEYRYPVILEQLQTLAGCLDRYPEEILRQTAANYDKLIFSLVQSIRGSAGNQSLSTATGIQFRNGGDAHVVLAAGPYQEQALYHELYHVMETHILSRSGALDRWNELNPAGFSYDLDLQANARRNSGVYLENGTRAFIDTYSMSFPKEDRARIFEYAMLPDQAHLFQSEIMQRKLHALCTAIREAYGLEGSEEIFPWETYLT